MEITTISFWGKSRYWWAVLLVGILLIPCGIWLVARPDIGYSVISLLLGWFLIILGILQLIIASDINRREQGWGWWLAGGILDILIGFLLVSNLVLSEIVLPYFFAFILLYRAIKNIVAGVMLAKAYKGWWLYRSSHGNNSDRICMRVCIYLLGYDLDYICCRPETL